MIDKNKMDEILSDLSKGRPVFHMEADFQLALFRKIANDLGDSEGAYLENLEKNGAHTDIYVKTKKLHIAIEIKYATKEAVLGPYGEKSKEVFRLKKQTGHTGRRYRFWNDVERLQEIVEKGKGETRGFALFLTNDEAYWSPDYGKGDNEDLRIYHGRNDICAGELVGRIKGQEIKVKTNYGYNLAWKLYGREGFQYLLVPIPPE
ncbi:MAG: hypothetical protein A2036_03920 [Omnitrophica bacterium GWA2_50_21]|nr:MAG: hypothetical protein A2036_03920 [Omnitrophica bacterium GWA2_50_21]